ncbi:MAG TPA: lipocalin-like domain-containing protein, partial [Arenicellales bacterium]|nr:lipocalin-like domain-containing protein [Arenicellales bacterium]
FREAVSPRPPDNPSRWATSQLYLAHAAVSDIDGEKYLSDERFARGALELAGASAAPFRIWLETWQMRGAADGDRLDGRVSADGERFAFDLEIRSTRPPVAHGARGLSAKGPAGNASYYYSYTGLKTRGEISVDGESFQVTGSSWFDHEWSSSALAEDQAGWDWLSLQLAGDRALMVFRLRHRTDPEQDFYSGTFVDGSGDVATLSNGQIRLQPLDHWTSEATGARYPVRWRLEIPHLDLSLTTEPRLLDQEFVHGFRYWEGAVAASGRLAGERIDGQGYVELTGYGAATD